MKKTIILQGFLQNSQAVYSKLKNNSEFSKYKICILEHNNTREESNTYIDKIRKWINYAVKIGFLNAIYLILTKKALLITEGMGRSNTLFAKKVLFINHGWGTKMSPGKNEIKSERAMKNYRLLCNTTDYIICNSKFDETYFLEGVENKNKIRYFPIGSPRNDYFWEDNFEEIRNIKTKLKIEDKKVFLYCPTHREDVDSNKKLMDKLINEFKEIDKLLERNNAVLVFRPHYFNKSIKNSFNQFNNIIYGGFEEYPDVRKLMLISNCLISDYSSIYIDYLLINKPIIHYCFDIDEYNEKRGLVTDYNNIIHFPGEKIERLSDIFNICIDNPIEYKESKSFFFNKVGKCTEDILEIIKDIMEEI